MTSVPNPKVTAAWNKLAEVRGINSRPLEPHEAAIPIPEAHKILREAADGLQEQIDAIMDGVRNRTEP